jgi:CRISPR system Cascade subunit CasA
MSRPVFDVLTEPWIPVIRADGTPDELGIIPCLEQAHCIEEIQDPSPIVEFGLYRLLVAFVLDALILAGRRPKDEHDLRDLIDAGAFDKTLLSDYVRACGDVFDLFHPEKPFLQTVMAGGEQKSVFDFYPTFPTGNNLTHFCHGELHQQKETPAGIARLLTMISPFNVKVKTGKPRTIVGDPPIYALPIGRTLLHTLALNLPLPGTRYTEGEERIAGPAWRSFPSQGSPSTTPAQSFTWPCRLVRVIPPGPDGFVHAVLGGAGLKGPRGWRDPSCAVLEDGKGRVRHLGLEEARPLWIDAGPLSICAAGSVRWGKSEWAFVRPAVVSNAFGVSQSSDVSIRFYAWRTRESKVFEWVRARWAVPQALGNSSRLGPVVEKEIHRSEAAALELRNALKSLAPNRATAKRQKSGSGKGTKQTLRLRSVNERCVRAYWLRLEREFAPLMSAVAALAPSSVDDPGVVAAATHGWRETIHDLALDQFDSGAKDFDADGDALERLVKARARLQMNLRKVMS